MKQKKFDLKKDENNKLGFVFDTMWITDPYTSECSRFLVNPITYYGIDIHDLDRMTTHNKIDIKDYQGWDTI